VVDIPPLDLDPFGERASVSVEMPLSFVVQDDVESVEVSLAMRAGLDLVRFGLYSVSSLGVGEKTDVSDNLAYLDKLDCAVNRYLGVGVVYVASFGEDATVGKLIVQGIVERPLAFIDSLSSLDSIAKFAIGPASESIEFVGFYPPADSYIVKMGRPDPGVFFPAIVTATLATIQMNLSPWV
jgi:hypothetical protein